MARDAEHGFLDSKTPERPDGDPNLLPPSHSEAQPDWWTPAMQRAGDEYGRLLYDASLGYGERVKRIFEAAGVPVPPDGTQPTPDLSDEREHLAEAEKELDQREAEVLRLDGELQKAQAAYDAQKSRLSALSAENETLKRERSELLESAARFAEAGKWLVRCLKDVIDRKPVRGLDEALTAWDAALAALAPNTEEES